jgi:hypothetical protein
MIGETFKLLLRKKRILLRYSFDRINRIDRITINNRPVYRAIESSSSFLREVSSDLGSFREYLIRERKKDQTRLKRIYRMKIPKNPVYLVHPV